MASRGITSSSNPSRRKCRTPTWRTACRMSSLVTLLWIFTSVTRSAEPFASAVRRLIARDFVFWVTLAFAIFFITEDWLETAGEEPKKVTRLVWQYSYLFFRRKIRTDRFHISTEKLQHDEVCAVCRDTHSLPVALLCGHVYCRKCIKTLCAHNMDTCPLCQRRFAIMTTRQSVTPWYSRLHHAFRITTFKVMIMLSVGIDMLVLLLDYCNVRFSINGRFINGLHIDAPYIPGQYSNGQNIIDEHFDRLVRNQYDASFYSPVRILASFYFPVWILGTMCFLGCTALVEQYHSCRRTQNANLRLVLDLVIPVVTLSFYQILLRLLHAWPSAKWPSHSDSWLDGMLHGILGWFVGAALAWILSWLLGTRFKYETTLMSAARMKW